MKPIVALAGLCLAASLHAAEDGTASAGVRYYAANCFNCHGTEGRINSAIPAIAGRDREFLLEALKAYKAGSKPATIMHQLAKGYTDAELAALADYFSRQK
jgi:cytochrome c553